ncbi:hypothetical protein [Variovorax sp. 3P27G3]|uniref:hypothetical protein n=1 Tax=Variovorax sp. 3P27G3 TaxID=2502214 RepID=UPI00201D4802|nr:hypothetical protein [Variovorax sp. 3P27G3]
MSLSQVSFPLFAQSAQQQPECPPAGASQEVNEVAPSLAAPSASGQQAGTPLRVLVACEYSGRVSAAFRAAGHHAWSCDLLPTEGDPAWHIQGDVRHVLDLGFDLMVAHPTCTRLANSGVRWLHRPPAGKTKAQMWAELEEAAAFYRELRDAPIPLKAIENPVMHRYARELIKPGPRQVVQPYWFGDPEFKATGLELIGLPPLKPTRMLTPPKPRTREHAEWSVVHRESPGPDRWRRRSTTRQGIAQAMAAQWGAL